MDEHNQPHYFEICGLVPCINRILQVQLLLLALVMSLSANGQTTSSGTFLIRNVVLFDPSGSVEDKVVNILLVDDKLDLVTEDKISSDNVTTVVNADNGFLVGRLNIGASPSFIIFRDDPRQNFAVLMDTLSHSVFTVDAGVVVKNWLTRVVHDPEEEPRKDGWLAYAPPPFMVPLDYQSTNKWNTFESKYVDGLFLSAMLIDRMNWQSQDVGSRDQWGNLDNFDGGEIRGFRFGSIGTLNFEKPWIYTMFLATNAFGVGFDTRDDENLTLYDLRLDIPFLNDSAVSIGKQKEPISMSRLTGSTFLPNQERAAVTDALLPSRNIGIVWAGSSLTTNTSWALGLFNNWLEEKESFSESSSQFIGRYTWAPFVNRDQSSVLHIGFGYRYSDIKQGFRYAVEPEFKQAPKFVDTGRLFGDNTQTYNVELAWRRGPLLLTSEYMRTKVSNRALGSPSFHGSFVEASWILTGEMRTYNSKSGVFGGIPVARSAYQGGKGAWEVYTRYSDINLTDGLVRGGEMQIASLGLNWWLTSFFSVNIGYKYIWNERNGMEGESSGLMTRLILVLE